LATSLAGTAILHRSPPFSSGTPRAIAAPIESQSARACSNSHCVSTNIA
jgi:hypothetical protein